MFKKDYLLKQLQTFLEELTGILTGIYKSSHEDIAQQLDSLYERYLNKERDFFVVNDLKTIYSYVIEIENLEILATLLYQDALTQSNDTKRALLNKSYAIFEKINTDTKVFSVKHQGIMQEIKRILSIL